MYSESGDAILVEGDVESRMSTQEEFSYKNSLRCPVCRYEIVKRSPDPSRDKAIFIEGMKYLTGGHEFEVEIEDI